MLRIKQPEWKITRVVARDPNTGNSNGFVYSLVGPESNTRFFINPTLGSIELKSPGLDYESLKLHSIVVRAKGPTSVGVSEIIVTVTDVNDNAPVFVQSLYAIIVNEDMALGQRIVQVSATDLDSSFNDNNRVTYNLISQSVAGQFNINSNTGLITLARNFNVESLVTSYTLSVSASNLGSSLVSQTPVSITVIIQDINDLPPIFTESAYNATVNENDIIGTSIITVTARDGDATIPNNDVRYSIIQPLASRFFEINEISGLITLRGNK